MRSEMLFALTLLTTVAAFAQSDRGTIMGTVADLGRTGDTRRGD
jgi:hypothetical protein